MGRGIVNLALASTKKFSASTINFRLIPAILLLITLPIAHTRSFTYLCITLSFILSFKIYHNHKMLPPKGILFSFIAFFLIALLSITWSNAPAVSFSQIKHELILGLVAFFGNYWLNRSSDNRNICSLAIIISFILTFAIACISNSGFNFSTWESNLKHVHGVGFYSTFITYLFPLMIIPIFLRPFPYSREAALICIALMLPISIANDNRMTFITIGSTFIFAAFLLTSKYRHKLNKIYKILLIIFTITLGAATIYNGIYSGLPKEDMTISEVAAYYSSKEPRIIIWNHWGKSIKQHPILGIGYGWRTSQKNDKAVIATESQNLPLKHAHNIFIDQAARTGIIGLAIFALTFFFVIRRFWQFYRANDRATKIIGITGLSFMLTVILKNLTDLFLSGHMYIYYFAIIGFLLGHGDYLLRKLKTEPSPRIQT